MLTDKQDAFGHMTMDFYSGKLSTTPVIKRDDRYFDIGANPEHYFWKIEEWMPTEQKVIMVAKSRVQDIGCGARRHALYPQEKRHEITSIDNPPLAVGVIRKRGVKGARLCSINGIGKRTGVFDTVMLLGNNFSVAGTPERT